MGIKSLVCGKKIDAEQGYLEARTLSSPPCWVVRRVTVINCKMSMIQMVPSSKFFHLYFSFFILVFIHFGCYFPIFLGLTTPRYSTECATYLYEICFSYYTR